jgi:RNA polymerase subunit RPABC4/transcription elongation factor Spt4
LSRDLEEHWKSQVAERFPQCPLCGSKSLIYDVEYGSIRDYIHCISCDAKWEIDWKGEDFEIEYLTLLEVGDSGKYGNLIKEKRSPEFWRKLMSDTNEQASTVKAEIVKKVRCEYCGTFYNEALDACPYCGGRMTHNPVLQGL